jgi:[ribosomal protein S18]-alanine N-acetyltransferase
VRNAGVEDLPGVVAMERRVPEAPHWVEGEYAAIIDAGSGVDGTVRRCLVVAVAEGRLLGFAVGKVVGFGADGVAELESVAVDLTARRSGVGRALCETVIDWCGSQGAEAMELEVRTGSEGAIALYAGLGFVAVGRREEYYREPTEDALLMRLDLAKKFGEDE